MNISRLVTAAWSLLLSAALVGSVPEARAEGSSGLYAVELVIFRASNPIADEDLSAVPPGRGFGNESTRGGLPQVVRVLAPADYRLTGVENSLRTSGTWRPIAHAAWIQSAASWGTHAGLELGDVGVNVPGLTGSIYLERATYLHLGFELTLNAGGVAYTIKEMRSIKFNERQYFDHPAFGVIAVVSPVGGSTAAATATAAPAAAPPASGAPAGH